MAGHRASATDTGRRPIRHLRRSAVLVTVLALAVVIGSSSAFAGVRKSAAHALGLGGTATTVIQPTTLTAPATTTDPSIDPVDAETVTAVQGHPSGTLTVVGLGDSVESGYACGCTSFVNLAARTLANTQQRSVTVHNEAFAGATSTDVLGQLADATVQAQVAASELVVIEIGANDFDESLAYDSSCTTVTEGGCFGSTLDEVQTNVGKIVSQVKALQTVPGAQVVVMGYWNVFEDGAVGQEQGSTYVAVSHNLTMAFNAEMATVAKEQGVILADAYTPFDGADGTRNPTGNLTSDGDHPNASGHQLLADAVIASLGGSVDTL